MAINILGNIIEQITVGQYADGSTGLQFYSQYGPAGKPTVCFLYDKPAEGNVFIKTYSEYEGWYEAMFAAGIVGPVVRYVQQQYATAVECKLLETNINKLTARAQRASMADIRMQDVKGILEFLGETNVEHEHLVYEDEDVIITYINNRPAVIFSTPRICE